MTGSGTQQPGGNAKPTADEDIEADPQPQQQPASNSPQEDDPEIEETEEQPS